MALKSKFSETAGPTAALRRQRTPPEILLDALDEIALIEATLEGREFKVSRDRYKKIDGVRKKVTVEATPRSWWLEIGAKLNEVPKTFRQLRESVHQGPSLLEPPTTVPIWGPPLTVADPTTACR